MRKKYRSAIYTFNDEQVQFVEKVIGDFQVESAQKIIIEVLPFRSFKLNKKDQLNYLYSRPDSPFCKTYIHPKLSLLMKNYSKNLNRERLRQIGY